MADTKQPNDEYEMPDIESYQEDSFEQENYEIEAQEKSNFSLSKNPALLKAGALVLAVVLVMLGYKFFGSWFTSSQTPKSGMPDISKIQTQAKPSFPSKVEQKPPVVSIAQPAPVISQPKTLLSPEVTRKIARLEISQRSIRDEVNSLNGQFGAVSGNVGALSDQIANLNGKLQMLMDKIDAQAGELHRLRVKRQVTKKTVKKRIFRTNLTWHIQAVIPGRAWLIASNGSTLTVRSGSVVPGMGTVRMIDTEQGKVIMSSGRMIRFSSQDS